MPRIDAIDGLKLAWLAAALLLAAVIVPGAARAQSHDPAPVFNEEQNKAIESLVRDYLLEHPEVMVESLQAYEKRQKEAEAKRQREALVAEAAALTEDPDAPILGNPDGDVTLVEFFDYRCPYCKKVSAAVARLLEEDPNLRLVMKEFPILSPESVQAARAALAAERQGRYHAFHFALMENGGGFTEEEIMAVAESVGLDEDQLRSDMEDPAIEQALRQNHALAERVGITGTPAFVIGGKLVPGAVALEQLRALVADARDRAS